MLSSVALIVAVIANTAPWCGTRVAVYQQTLLAALCLDVILVQPVFVLFVWMWRWMISEEEDGRAVHTVHPIDGQRRVVGPLWDDRVEDYVVDAAGLKPPEDNVGIVHPVASTDVPPPATRQPSSASEAHGEVDDL
jgi:hypothetical protein